MCHTLLYFYNLTLLLISLLQSTRFFLCVLFWSYKGYPHFPKAPKKMHYLTISDHPSACSVITWTLRLYIPALRNDIEHKLRLHLFDLQSVWVTDIISHWVEHAQNDACRYILVGDTRIRKRKLSPGSDVLLGKNNHQRFLHVPVVYITERNHTVRLAGVVLQRVDSQNRCDGHIENFYKEASKLMKQLQTRQHLQVV